MRLCDNLNEVRQEIDKIDCELIGLIAKRGDYVQQAAKFKKTTGDVKAPDRVEQIICKVKTLAAKLSASESVVEATYRAMISAFIKVEMSEYAHFTNSISLPMENFIIPPNHIDFKAKKISQNDVNATMLDLAVAYVEPGGGGPSPSHAHDKDHFFIVVEGCATIRTGNQSIVLQTDETTYIKGSVEHSVWNESNHPLKIIKINCIQE